MLWPRLLVAIDNQMAKRALWLKTLLTYVIEHGEDGDIIVLAGKGHEDYQIIQGVKYHMDERELVEEVKTELGLV